MMNFPILKSLAIPDGVVVKIESNGKTLWILRQGNYVSLGDSIAAGHTIDDRWEIDYGEDSQYDKNGNTSTTIVPNSYTDLIRSELVNTYGEYTQTTSFARSGDTVADLMDKLTHTVVKNVISEADIVTICIGANDVLQPALSHLEEYISTGDLSTLETIVEGNLANLNTDSNATSYISLFNKLNEINPNAKYVFTTIYNPYKYLWIEEGHYGFFGPLLQSIPSMEILGLDVDSFIKDSLLGTPIVKQLFSRINGLNAWAEKYVSKLNQVLKNKISNYQSTNSNFIVADTKALFDTFPDRPIPAERHYNDLVSVEYTRDYNTATMDWGRLWAGNDVETFWWDLVTKYVSLSGMDINGFANDLISQIVEKVVVPDIDPHPETYGHYVLQRSFADILEWTSLDRYTITFNANGGNGSMAQQSVVSIDGLPAYVNIKGNSFTHPTEGYYFTGWNTKADGSGTSYSDGQLVGVTSDLVLYAQWAIKQFTVTFRITEDSNLVTSSDTGNKENYALWIDGVEQSDLDTFGGNNSRTYTLPYGTSIGIIAQTNSGDARSYITVNGNRTDSNNSKDARYGFTLTSNVDINFEYNYFYSGINAQKYWNCYITTY